MSSIVPLVRASALRPFFRWLQDNDRSIDDVLQEAGLGVLNHANPDGVVPVISGAEFLRIMSDREGPDIGCRVVGPNSLVEIGSVGAVLLSAHSPKEGFLKASALMPHHGSHEHIAVETASDGLWIREFFAIKLDQTALHVIQQYVARLIQLAWQSTGARWPIFDVVEITSHPRHGVAHLQPWLGPGLVQSSNRALRVHIPEAIANRRYKKNSSADCGYIPSHDWDNSLRADGSLSHSVRLVVKALLQDGRPTVQQVAGIAEMSTRTFQRRLEAEGVDFSALVDEVRNAMAVELLEKDGIRVSEVSTALGYSAPANLTRAVRRWTGRTPTTLKKHPTS